MKEICLYCRHYKSGKCEKKQTKTVWNKKPCKYYEKEGKNENCDLYTRSRKRGRRMTDLLEVVLISLACPLMLPTIIEADKAESEDKE